MNRPRYRIGLRTSNAIYSTVIFNQALNLCMAFDLALPPDLNDDVRRILKGFDPEKQMAIYQYAATMINKRKNNYE